MVIHTSVSRRVKCQCEDKEWKGSYHIGKCIPSGIAYLCSVMTLFFFILNSKILKGLSIGNCDPRKGNRMMSRLATTFILMDISHANSKVVTQQKQLCTWQLCLFLDIAPSMRYSREVSSEHANKNFWMFFDPLAVGLQVWLDKRSD